MGMMESLVLIELITTEIMSHIIVGGRIPKSKAQTGEQTE